MTLVTGGAGFIGSHLVARLALRGERVRVLDNFATGSRENLRDLGPNVVIIEGDLRDPGTVEDAASGCDYLLHLGALGSVPRSIDDPKTTNDVNVAGTLNVLMAARSASVERVVFASSSSIYGDGTSAKVETMMPGPMSPYAASKLAGETYCRAFSRTYGIEVSILRYFNVFGPMQVPDSPYSAVIPRVITAMMDGDPPVVFGDGLQSRDFTFVSNVVVGTLMARDLPSAAGQTMNIACGESHNILALVDEVNRQLGTRFAANYLPDRKGDVKHSFADISKARSVGYEPEVDFQEGIARTIDYYRQAIKRSE